MLCCGPTLVILLSLASVYASNSPPVFPVPQQIEMRGGEGLALDESVPILLPEHPSAEDLFLARFLSAELSDRYALALRTKRVGLLPERGPFILMGSTGNPLVQQNARQGHPAVSEREGYLLDVDRDRAVVAGADEAGAFYGLQSLRQLIARAQAGARIQGAIIRDWPFKPFRGIKLYLPGRGGKTAFAFEWINPRFGKVIREVRLRSVSESNPVTLEKISIVPKRAAPEPKPLRMAP
jgi:hyaluronoglucosaminidase